MKKLIIDGLVKLFSGILLTGALTFIPAGTLHFWQGWVLLGTLFIPMFIAGLVMIAKNPDLLRKRLNAKEKQAEQKTVVALSGLMFIAAFVLAGLNFRYGWMTMPPALTWIAAVIFLAGYVMYAEVMRENAYLSRTIEVQENQKVVDTGLYGIVRHPMYSATLLLFLSMPLILGSIPSFIITLTYIPIIHKRMTSEERLLAENLKGYKEYMQKVKYRIIPFIW